MSSKKPFFEVFAGFDPGEGEIKDLFSEVMVSKITMTSSRTKMDIYIECPHPIHKKDLYATQKALSGSLDDCMRSFCCPISITLLIFMTNTRGA